ncbi:DUF4297 family anti-phage-associated protein [Sphingobacterium thalpophilum]|uniref:Uncharacterized protein n=1 Tax=Sphingobacterium thalpophilum TaxID=259 RepID=A0A4U9V9X6_9SPHI|nr:DUF4297 family anti-phage-associated protein [Sphingobacterium thalpophilum]VTR43556.1 Uncharacterised protein [Sphingobacterium thalpophilum]
MADRSAIDTIKGYFYQFDYTILSLLKLSQDTDAITIEGIEDIDISTATEESAIQCKYYSKTEYNHSVIAEPIRWMLSHFAEYKKGKAPEIKYILRGHYKSGHDKLSLPINTQFLKTHFLTYNRTVKEVKKTFEHHNILGLTDTDLQEFIKVLEIDINAEDFENQYKEIVQLLKSYYSCSEFTAEHFFYNNALRAVKELSIKKSLKSRRVNKADFFQLIDKRQILFHEWFVIKNGEKKHFANLKKEFFTFLNVSSFERIFIIEIDTNQYTRVELKELIFIISKKWSKISKREPKPFCPYIYIHNINEKELIELKKELLSEDFKFIDGYNFNGADFNPSSIVQRADYSNQIKIKFINKITFIDGVLKATKGTKELYQFYLKQPFYQNDQASIKHIQIQINQLSNIKNII